MAASGARVWPSTAQGRCRSLGHTTCLHEQLGLRTEQPWSLAGPGRTGQAAKHYPFAPTLFRIVVAVDTLARSFCLEARAMLACARRAPASFVPLAGRIAQIKG